MEGGVRGRVVQNSVVIGGEFRLILCGSVADGAGTRPWLEVAGNQSCGSLVIAVIHYYIWAPILQDALIRGISMHAIKLLLDCQRLSEKHAIPACQPL